MFLIRSIFFREKNYICKTFVFLRNTLQLVSYYDDGFTVTAVEPWFKVKVEVVQQYIRSFVTHLAAKADEIILIDLFAGSGLYSTGYQKDLFPANALASLQTDLPIHKWIFCEPDFEKSKALKIRVNKYFRGKNVVLFENEPGQAIDKFRSYVPTSKNGYRVATLCIVDPFSLEMPFSTFEKLAGLGYSFLMVYNFHLDDHHNHRFYCREQSDRLHRFLGGHHEEKKLADTKSNLEFYKRLVQLHQNNMLMLGLNTSLSVHKLQSQWMQLPMYYAGFYSRQLTPKLVQKEVQAASTIQTHLF
jgi:three-Cys-motif partner protein